MASRRFQQVDVFTAEPYRGNPVAVVIDGDGLTTAEMQRFAHWTNLSETTFVIAPASREADYGLRIFTTTEELPFAGHPTLGSCHAWLSSGGVPHDADEVVQECGAGLVRIRRDEGRLAFAAPPLLRSGALDDATLSAACTALGIGTDRVVDSAWIDNGPGWLGLLLSSADEVLALRCAATPLKIGVAGRHPVGHDAALEVRAFYPAGDATFEDPVTGSLNASLAQWLTAAGHIALPYTATQGAALGRAGRIRLDGGSNTTADGTIWVGGSTVTCISGTVEV